MRIVRMNVYNWSLLVASYDMWVLAVDRKGHTKVGKWVTMDQEMTSIQEHLHYKEVQWKVFRWNKRPREKTEIIQ